MLGKLIGGALVGTFLGVLMAYGFVGPLATAIRGAQEFKYLGCIKAGILAHVQGYAPAVSVEFARKSLMATTVRRSPNWRRRPPPCRRPSGGDEHRQFHDGRQYRPTDNHQEGQQRRPRSPPMAAPGRSPMPTS